MVETGQSDSKLRDSIKTYGSNSYYYAHSRKIEIPSDAIRVEGEGIVTGGTPVLLKLGEVNSSASLSTAPSKRLTAYSWADSGDSVKIYIEDQDWLNAAGSSADAVTSEFESKALSLKLASIHQYFSIENLDDEIDPINSFVRLSPGKRLTITLKKKKENKTWYSLRKN